MAANNDKLCLGIDLGTTSVKISLVEVASRTAIFNTSEPTHADELSDAGPGGSEQNVQKILDTVASCLNRITDKNRSRVACISVAGQMHCAMLWNGDSQVPLSDNSLTASNNSRLYTWQDQRASNEFIATLPTPDSHQTLASGFGCVTLFWLAKNTPEIFLENNVAGSIEDYLVALLCGLDRPVMSHQIATSWGYFDSDAKSWNSEILKEAGFPVHVLPVVVDAGAVAGKLCRDWFGIPAGIPVLAGLGDLQCAHLSAAENDTDAVLNLSTSCQLSHLVLVENFLPPRIITPTSVSYFPYLNDTYLAVAASLNGGNALGAFVKMILQWFSVFGAQLKDDIVWAKLTELSRQPPTDPDNGLMILPVLFGERHCPTTFASVAGIHRGNTDLGSVFRALCDGVVNNLHQMLPSSKLMESGIQRVVVSGSVIDRQPYVLECVQRTYTVTEVTVGMGTNSAWGAGIVGCRYLEKCAQGRK